MASFPARTERIEKRYGKTLFKIDTILRCPSVDEIRCRLPAAERKIRQHEAEIDAILANTAEPILKIPYWLLTRGPNYWKVTGAFYPLNSADTNDEMQELAREVSPR